MTEATATDTTSDARGTFWREVPIAVVMGLATLASGWSSYQSALWEGIQTFRLTEMHDVGRDIAVQEVALGQRRVLDIFMLERFLEERENGQTARAEFLFSRLSPELQPVTRAWLETRPKDNPAAPRSPFLMQGYKPDGFAGLGEMRRKQATIYASADSANKISDTYVRITVFFGLAMFLTGISAVLKGPWARGTLIACSVAVMAFAGFLLFQLPLAAE